VTIDEIIDSCTESGADDWAFWVYLCGDAGGPQQSPGTSPGTAEVICARAVYLGRREIGLAWSPAVDEELSHLQERALSRSGGECVYHWVELLYEGTVIDRHLAGWLVDERVSLPVPQAEPRDDGDPVLWVSRRAYRLVRLANEIDLDCADFDACFARSGIEVR
jgi:hypothetical protein